MKLSVNKWFGLLYSVFWIGLAAGQVGEMPEPPEPYPVSLPLIVLVIFFPLLMLWFSDKPTDGGRG